MVFRLAGPPPCRRTVPGIHPFLSGRVTSSEKDLGKKAKVPPSFVRRCHHEKKLGLPHFSICNHRALGYKGDQRVQLVCIAPATFQVPTSRGRGPEGYPEVVCRSAALAGTHGRVSVVPARRRHTSSPGHSIDKSGRLASDVFLAGTRCAEQSRSAEREERVTPRIASTPAWVVTARSGPCWHFCPGGCR